MKKLLANQSFAIIAALVAGCDGRGVSGAGETACDGCQHSQYVVSSLQIPAQGQAMRMGCDLDGDGQVDNALGRVLAVTTPWARPRTKSSAAGCAIGMGRSAE